MVYTLTSDDLRNLAREFKEDLDEVYLSMNDPDPESPPLSLGDLKCLERRREELLGRRGMALSLAKSIDTLNYTSADDSTGLLRELLDEAATQWPSKRVGR